MFHKCIIHGRPRPTEATGPAPFARHNSFLEPTHLHLQHRQPTVSRLAGPGTADLYVVVLIASLHCLPVARHLSNLSLTSTPPSYIQPAYYSTAAAFGNLTTYQHEVSHISTMNVPHSGHERADWDATRNDLFRMMPYHSLSR